MNNYLTNMAGSDVKLNYTPSQNKERSSFNHGPFSENQQIAAANIEANNDSVNEITENSELQSSAEAKKQKLTYKERVIRQYQKELDKKLEKVLEKVPQTYQQKII